MFVCLCVCVLVCVCNYITCSVFLQAVDTAARNKLVKDPWKDVQSSLKAAANQVLLSRCKSSKGAQLTKMFAFLHRVSSCIDIVLCFSLGTDTLLLLGPGSIIAAPSTMRCSSNLLETSTKGV